MSVSEEEDSRLARFSPVKKDPANYFYNYLCILANVQYSLHNLRKITLSAGVQCCFLQLV